VLIVLAGSPGEQPALPANPSGILFHQILQWHHMLTAEGCCSPDTVDGLQDNTLADGFFHVARPSSWVGFGGFVDALLRRPALDSRFPCKAVVPRSGGRDCAQLVPIRIGQNKIMVGKAQELPLLSKASSFASPVKG
jgi:hypothetical protein